MSSKLSASSVLKADNCKMPVVGLGTWQSTDEEIEKAIDTALEVGYRHIDTARVYLNEDAIGKALEKWFKSGKLKREDIFVVTKLPAVGNRPCHVEEFLKKSLQSLKLDYVDLYLVHTPVGIKYHGDNLFPVSDQGILDFDFETDLVALWKEMEKQVDAGRTKAIGVSNFNAKQIERLVKVARIPPANLQVEMHVYFQQKELVKCCKDNNITMVAYAPLGSPGLLAFTEKRGFPSDNIPKLSPMSDEVVKEIADTHKKLPSQVLLRFLLQTGVAVIPKSTNPERIKQNFEVFDFELSNAEMERLRALDKGEGGRMFGKGGIFKGAEKHPENPF